MRFRWGAVAAAALASWAVSVAWYMVFGTTWAELVALPTEWEFEIGTVLLGLFFNAVLALGVAVVLRAAGARGAAAGARWGLALALLLLVPAHAGKWVWQDKPLLFAIDAGGHVLCLLAAGAILGWRSRPD